MDTPFAPPGVGKPCVLGGPMCPSPAGTDTHPTDEELQLSCKSTRGHFPATPQLLTAIYYFPKIVIKTNVWGFTASSTQQETADGAVNATAPLQDRGWRGCLTRKAPSHPFPGAPPIPWWPLWPFFAPTWAEKLEVATSQGQNWRKKTLSPEGSAHCWGDGSAAKPPGSPGPADPPNSSQVLPNVGYWPHPTRVPQ